MTAGPAPSSGDQIAGGGGRLRMFASLRERDYAWYFVGNTAFFLALQMNIVVRGFLAYDLTTSATALGVVSLAFALPMMFVSPFGGVFSDRLNKRKLLMVAQSCSALVNLVIAIMVITGIIEFWHLVIAAVLTGSIMSFVMPARQAVIPQLVPQQLLMNAISLQMGGMNLTRIAGPALGGLLIAPLGVGGVYLVTVFLFVLGVISLFPLPSHGMVSQRTSAAPALFADLTEGFRYIAADPLFRLLITAALVMPLFMFPVQQILPVFAADTFGSVFADDEGGAIALGLLMGSTGVGGFVGAMLSANLSDVPQKGRMMAGGAIIMTVCFAAFAAASMWLPIPISFWTAITLLIAGNVGGMLFQVTNNTIVQARVPDQYRGRVMSVLMMSFGTMPLGVFPVTIAADRWGAPVAILGAQIIALSVVLLIFGLSARLRRFEFSSLERAELSPAQAARLVAEGKISQEEADRRSGRAAHPGEVAARARTGGGRGQAAG